MSIVPNPLNKYRSFNYRWGLSAVAPGEVNNPLSYKSNGGNFPIIRSGGLADKPSTVKTFVEESLGLNLEFFIDNVTIDSLISPNPGTGVATVTQFSFTVTEPYSVGLFFQALNIASHSAGFKNGAMTAPFLLTVDFIGHTDGEKIETFPKRCFLINITDVTFTVGASGSVYQVSAIPFSHIGLTDEIQQVKTSISLMGDTVEQMLHSGPLSLTYELNRQEQERVISKEKAVGDTYTINFPLSTQSSTGLSLESGSNSSIQVTNPLGPINNFTSGIQGGRGNVVEGINDRANRLSSLTTANTGNNPGNTNATGYFGSPTATLNTGNNPSNPNATGYFPTLTPTTNIGNNPGNPNAGGYFGSIPVVSNSIPASVPYNPNSNVFGNSRIILDFKEFGNNPFQPDDIAYDETTGVYTRGNFTINSNTRIFEFRENTKIEKIIESVILSSEWGQNLINQTPDPVTKMINWFRIDAKTLIKSTEEIIGRDAYEFVYSVIPYKVHYSVFESPNAEQDYTANINNVCKMYNYSYTGLNTDIMNFEFNLNASYYVPIVNLQSGMDKSVANVIAVDQIGYGVGKVDPGLANSTNLATNIPRRSEAVTIVTSNDGGPGYDTTKKRVAELFNTLVLNSDVGNTALTLQIWGDPWYLADTDAGNYRSTPDLQYSDADGNIDIHNTEIDVIIRFKSGADIKNNLMLLDPVNNFNGIYKVTSFSSTFNNGQFMQELSLLRRPNQSDQTLSIINALVDTYLSGLDNSYINQLIQDRISNLSQSLNPFINALPQELKRFFNIENFNINELQTLGSSNIFNLINQSQQLLTIGNSIQGIGGMLGGGLGGTLGRIGSTLGGVGGALGGIASLTSLAGSVGNLAAGSKTSAVNVAGVGSIASNPPATNTGNNPGNANAAGYFGSTTATTNTRNNPGNANAAGYFGAITSATARTNGSNLTGTGAQGATVTSSLAGLSNGTAVNQAIDQLPPFLSTLSQTFASTQATLPTIAQPFANTANIPAFSIPASINPTSLLSNSVVVLSSLSNAKTALQNFRIG
jgi:hypothetical protein